MPGPASRFTLAGPCASCPFRTDMPVPLREGRVREIADSIQVGEDFMCHKTVDYSCDDDEDSGDGRVANKTRVCGGARATLAKQGSESQMERITGRLGLKVTPIDPEAPVFDSVREWVTAMTGGPKMAHGTFDGVEESLPFEHCDHVGPDCIDPPGFGTGGGVAYSTEDPTCNPFEDWCRGGCGSVLCSGCKDENGMCSYCSETDEEDE
jgi:hypothetical protein